MCVSPVTPRVQEQRSLDAIASLKPICTRPVVPSRICGSQHERKGSAWDGSQSSNFLNCVKSLGFHPTSSQSRTSVLAIQHSFWNNQHSKRLAGDHANHLARSFTTKHGD